MGKLTSPACMQGVFVYWITSNVWSLAQASGERGSNKHCLHPSLLCLAEIRTRRRILVCGKDAPVFLRPAGSAPQIWSIEQKVKAVCVQLSRLRQ